MQIFRQKKEKSGEWIESMGGRRDAPAQKAWQSGGGLWYTKAAAGGEKPRGPGRLRAAHREDS